MNQDFTLKMKEILEKERERLQKELETFTKKNVHAKGDYESQFPDFGNETDENAHEVATFGERLSIEKTLEKELRDTEKALQKIEEGTYGVCKYCGQDLSEERLKARPTSSTCVACKKKLKHED